MAINRGFQYGPQQTITRYDPEKIGGGAVTSRYNSDGTIDYVSGGHSDQDQVDRYRSMGEAAAKRGAFQSDWSGAQANEANGVAARDSQLDATGLLRNAAQGSAPSAADIQGSQVGSSSLAGMLGASAGSRGGMGTAAAQSGALGRMGGTQLGGLAQYTGQRGNEMTQAQNAYGAAGTALRAGDVTQQGLAAQRAQTDAASQFAQRQLNDQAQTGYEQMGINSQQDEVNADLRKDQMQTGANNAANAKFDADQARNTKNAIAYTSMVAAAASDERAKQNVRSLGDIAMHGPSRLMLSDDRTKLAKAWDEGHNSALSEVQDMRMKSPDELKALGAKGNRLANALRGAKADAYDEAMAPKPPPIQFKSNIKQQPPSAPRQAASTTVDRADPDAFTPLTQDEVDRSVTQRSEPPVKPGMGARIERGIGDAMTSMYPSATNGAEVSDERAKEGMHAEGDMGRALEQGFKPYEYEYKPGFDAAERQTPGEKNVGPMAQNMASNPVTGTAVKKMPNGLLVVDIPKATKVNSAGIGYLAAKMRQQEEELAKLKGAR